EIAKLNPTTSRVPSPQSNADRALRWDDHAPIRTAWADDNGLSDLPHPADYQWRKRWRVVDGLRVFAIWRLQRTNDHRHSVRRTDLRLRNGEPQWRTGLEPDRRRHRSPSFGSASAGRNEPDPDRGPAL